MSEKIKVKHKQESEKAAFERIKQEEDRRLEQQREAARRAERRIEMEARREAGEYEDNEKAHALRQYLIDIGDWEAGNPEEFTRISNEIEMINNSIEELEMVGQGIPENEELQNKRDELNLQLVTLESELDDATGHDIYQLHEEGYEHYGLTVFIDEINNAEYAIGDDDEADSAAKKQVESFIDEFKDQPGMGFTAGFIDGYVDGDKVVAEYKDQIEEMVRESPDSYINDDAELSSEGQEKIDEKRNEISDLENKRSELEDKKYEMEANEEDTSDIDSEIDEIDTQISDLESEIEDIESDDDYKEYSEEQIEAAVQSRLEDFRNDPIGELKEWGVEDLTPYINEDELIDGVIASDGRGMGLSGYDGEENEITYDGTTYYIYRTN